MGRLAATALRLLAPRSTGGVNTASGDDIANLVTTPLPNHTLVWAAGTLLELDRDDSTSSALIADSQPIVVVPNIGPGRWKAIAGAGMLGASNFTRATQLAQALPVSGAGEWSIMPAASVFQSLQNSWWNSGGQGSVSGVMTWNGPPARFLVNVSLSVINSQSNLTQTRAAYSLNGAFIGLTTALNFAGIQGISDSTTQQVFGMGTAELDTGDTIQPIFTSDNGDAFVLQRGQMTLTYLGNT